MLHNKLDKWVFYTVMFIVMAVVMLPMIARDDPDDSREVEATSMCIFDCGD